MLLSSAYSGLLSTRPGYKQSFPLPLALCTPHGEMRACVKSKFRDVIIDTISSSSFVTKCPFLCPIYTDHELIVDFLYLLHQPPPPDIKTFAEYAHYMWDRVVLKLGVRRGAQVVRIVVDKPSFLPKPRDLLHAQRSSRTGQIDAVDIYGDNAIPHATEYQQLLANPQLKRTFLSYLMQQFTVLTCRANLPTHVIIDYEYVICPVNIYRGKLLELPMLANNNGEADYNVWYHCMKSTHSHIIVLGSDTDIWVYGMALMDCGWIEHQVIFVEKSINSEYVDLNALSVAVAAHPQLATVRYPMLALAAIYIISGSDYISSFFRTSKQVFVRTFIDNIKHVCADGVFVETGFCTCDDSEHLRLTNINREAWIRLVCCVYLLKHKTLYNSEPISILHTSLTNPPLRENKIQLLKWLAYSNPRPLRSLPEWHDFTRRVCFYHSSGSKDHESCLVPSLGALKLQLLRAEFVLKTLF